MRRVSDYAVVRLHDGRYRLDRTTPPASGPVAYAKPVIDRLAACRSGVAGHSSGEGWCRDGLD
jgi:hypothetical protein